MRSRRVMRPRPVIQPYASVAPRARTDQTTIRELIHPKTHRNKALSLAESIIPAGTRTTLHRHSVIEEVYHVTAGAGLMTLGAKTFPVAVGDSILIPPGTPHCIEADGGQQLHVLCCCSPASSHEDIELLEGDDVSEIVAPVTQEHAIDNAGSPHYDGQPLTGTEIGLLRLRRGLTQREFWGRLFCTQSAGSRYEAGQAIPGPTLLLLRLAYASSEEALGILVQLREPFRELKPVDAELMADVDTGSDVAALRNALRLQQQAFWGAIGLTQSGGSRYEHGREIPRSTLIVLRLVFGPEQRAQRLLKKLRMGSVGLP